MATTQNRFAFLNQSENRESFFARIAQIFPRSDVRFHLIEKAYDTAKDAFRGIERDGGERYFEHIRAVTLILVDYLYIRDHELIIAAILHDLVEDIAAWDVERVEREFGIRVARLVDYLSKPRASEMPDKRERERIYHDRFEQAPREFFIVKMADRLHNLLTLGSCSEEKRRRKMVETVTHYLPHARKHLILVHEIEDALAALGGG
jgi:(p)ppGpp synthase/HD superfamily hydrolase